MEVSRKLTGVARTARQDDLADVDTSDKAVGLAERTTHTGLKSIGTGTRQHLVDTDDVVGVGADAEVEGLLTGGLHHVPWRCVSRKSSFSPGACRGYVLVGANTGSLEGLGGDLLILVGDEVNAEGELVDVGLLATEIEDANLGVGDTTVEARLRVRLLSITVSGMFFSVVVVSSFAARPNSTIFCAPSPPAVLIGVRRQAEFFVPCSCSNGNISRDDGPF